MPRRLITTYAMLPRGGSSALPPPPPPPPPPLTLQEPAPPQGDEKGDSDDEEFFADLPTDAEEATAEQRAILASFEMWRRDQAAHEFMAAERRAAVARLVDDHAAACAVTHRRNIEAARAAMAAMEQRLAQADVAGGLATMAAESKRREN
jgi:hypothetical protein